MKKFWIVLAILVVVLLAAVNIVLLFPPTGYAKQKIVAGVKEATGLDVKIDGAVSLRLIPSVNLRVDAVELSNPATPGLPLLAAKAVEVRADGWPLLMGSRTIDRVRLIEPRFALSIDKDGKPNWSAATGTAAAAPTPAPAPAAAPQPASDRQPATGTGTGTANEPKVVTLQVVGGNLVYRDARENIIVAVRDIEASAGDVKAAGAATALVKGSVFTIGDGSGSQQGTLSDVSVTAKDLTAAGIGEVTLQGRTLSYKSDPGGQTATAEQIAGTAGRINAQGAGPVAVSAAKLGWRDTRSGAALALDEASANLGRVGMGSLEGVTFKSGSLAWQEGGKGSTLAFEQVSATAARLAPADPVDAEVAFVWNKERVGGRARLPQPVAFLASPAGPVELALASSKGNIDFNGALVGGDTLRARGKTKASTASLGDLARWLGVDAPASVKGAASVTGDIDARGQRIELTNGRIEHEATAATGSLTVDLAGLRPTISGRLAADKLDANTYLGLAATPVRAVSRASTRGPDAAQAPVAVVPPVSVKDSLKAYMRALLDAPPTRSGTMEVQDVPLEQLNTTRARPAVASPDDWSSERIDLTPLKSVDLDLDLAVKSLLVRDYDIAVPQLKATLKSGALVLDGANLTTRTSKLSARATIDASQSVPQLKTTFTAEGIDVSEIFETAGTTAMITGASNVEGDLTGSGASQKQIVESLTGRVRARMAQGSIVGYDFSSIWSWLFGERKFDPQQRTPFNRLDAQINLDKGISRASRVEVDGPILGLEGDGTIRLPEKDLDYRARFRLSSLFGQWAVRIFGDWDKPSVTPDLGVFSRSPGGQAPLTEMLRGVDLEDAELASLIGRVLDRAGPRGLNPVFAENLRALQSRAQGQR